MKDVSLNSRTRHTRLVRILEKETAEPRLNPISLRLRGRQEREGGNNTRLERDSNPSYVAIMCDSGKKGICKSFVQSVGPALQAPRQSTSGKTGMCEEHNKFLRSTPHTS